MAGPSSSAECHRVHQAAERLARSGRSRDLGSCRIPPSTCATVRVAQVALDEQPRRMVREIDRERELPAVRPHQTSDRQQHVGDRNEASRPQTTAGPSATVASPDRVASPESRGERRDRSTAGSGRAPDSPASAFPALRGRPWPHRRGRPPRTVIASRRSRARASARPHWESRRRGSCLPSGRTAGPGLGTSPNSLRTVRKDPCPSSAMAFSSARMDARRRSCGTTH